MKVWITTYALTTGIECVDAKIVGKTACWKNNGGYGQSAGCKDWHRTE